MHESVYFNGRIVESAQIAAVSSAALYGRGVFSTIAVQGGKPFLLDKHCRRLIANAATLGLELPITLEDDVCSGLSELIEANDLFRGRARVTIFDESESRMWSDSHRPNISLLMIAGEARPTPIELSVTLSPHNINSTSALAGIKSCNYLEHLLAYEEAGGRGFNEAIRVNEKGGVTSACMANVFWESDGKLVTPSLSTGCLPGTTREFVMENLECKEVESGIEEIETAHRIFLTSAGIGVVAAVEFAGRKLDASDHPILNLMPN